MVVANLLPTDPENVAVSGWIGGDPGPRVVKFNVPASRRESLYMPPLDDARAAYWGYVLDGHAQVRFVRMTKAKEVTLLYRPANDAAFAPLRRDRQDGDGRIWSDIECAAEGKKIFVISYEKENRGALHEFDAATRTLLPAHFIPPTGEIMSLIWNSDHTDLAGVVFEDERRHYHWFDSEEAALRKKLESSFPGMEVSVHARSLDNQVRIIHVGSDREPGVFFLFDRAAGSLVQFKRERDTLDARLLRAMEPITFAARDGSPLHGYVTRPFAAEGGPVPMVILVHGGPFGARDSWGFDAEVQFLVSRGYAVLQVNFRGSAGYGADFLQQGRRQWGRLTQDDITDGVQWAIAQKIADPRRIAIYGASFGGYAALIGAELTPDLYRCAINYAGVADLEITGRPRGADAWMTADDFDYRHEWIGETKAYRDATNPVRLVERLKVPTLHAYGRNDPRVSIDQWDRLEAQLKKFNKPYEAIISKRAGHGFTAERDVVAFHEALAKFLQLHLGTN